MRWSPSSFALHGETPGGQPVEAQVFRYPVELCEWCLTNCATVFVNADETREEILGDACDDDAGADGRVCFNPDC